MNVHEKGPAAEEADRAECTHPHQDSGATADPQQNGKPKRRKPTIAVPQGGAKSDSADLPHTLAEAIIDKDHFAQDAGGELVRYRDGHYKSKGDEFVRRRVKELLEEAKLTGNWSSHLANEVRSMSAWAARPFGNDRR